MKNILNRINMKDGESLASYICRLFKANHYENVTDITESLGIRLNSFNNNDFKNEAIQRISDLSKKNKSELESRTLRSLSKGIEKKSLSDAFMHAGRIKYCPECIQNEIHHKSIWQFHPVGICLEHECYLQDHCQNCQSKIILNQFMVGLCFKCGSFFQNSTPEKVDTHTNLYKSQKIIQEAVIFKSKIPSFSGPLSLSKLITLAQKSFYLIDGHKSTNDSNEKISILSNRKDCHHQNKIFLLAYANVLWMYQNTNNYKTALLNFYNNTPIKVRNHHLLQYEKLFKSAGYAKLKKVYDTFWLDLLNSGVIKKDFTVFNNNPILIKDNAFISKKELSKIWRFSDKQFEKLLKNDDIETKIIYKNGCKKYLINKHSVEALLKERTNFISQLEAARLLGISIRGIHTLISMKKLKLYEISCITSKLIDRRECAAILNSFKGKSYTNSVKLIPFHSAINQLPKNRSGIAYLVDKISNGKLTTYSKVKSPKLSDLYFDKNELLSLKMILKNDGNFLSKDDAMKLIKVSINSINQLIDDGTLTPDKIKIFESGKRRIWFKKATIQKFQDDYININKVSYEYQIPKDTVKRWVKEGKIEKRGAKETRSYFLERRKIITFIHFYETAA